MLDRTDGRHTIWGELTVIKLKALWGLGQTATQIAEQIPGSTRNSVLGKVHRLNLPVRIDLQARPSRPPKVRVPREPKPARVAPRVAAFRKQIQNRAKAQPPEFLGLDLLDLKPNACRYPHGEGPYFFCGQPKEPTSSYCSYHAGLCFPVKQ